MTTLVKTSGQRGYVLATLIILGVALGLLAHRGAGLIDFQVYRLGGQTLLRGGDLYQAHTHHGSLFTYPPFAAIIFLPMAAMPFQVGYVVWTTLNAAALVAFVKVHFPAWTLTNGRLFTTALAAACLEPIWQNFFLGQIDLLLALAISVDLLAPSGRRRRGLLTGACIGIKLTPAIFVPLLLLVHQRRAARNAVIGFIGTVLLALLVAPSDAAEYWLHDVFSAGRVGDQTFANNQSVLAALLRILKGTSSAPYVRAIWLVLAVAFLSAALAVGRAWWRRGEPRVGLAATALGGLLASPVSWTHHWVWCLPMIAALIVTSARAGLPKLVGPVTAACWALAFVIAPTLWLPRHGGRELGWTPWQTLAGTTYLWLAVAALAHLAYLASRPPVDLPVSTYAAAEGHRPEPVRGDPVRAGGLGWPRVQAWKKVLDRRPRPPS